MLENFQACMKKPLLEKESSKPYPIGIIEINDGVSVTLHFLHYSSFKEAEEKWNQRKARIDQKNMGVMLTWWGEGEEIDPEILKRFDDLSFEHKVAFVDEKNSYMYKALI